MTDVRVGEKRKHLMDGHEEPLLATKGAILKRFAALKAGSANAGGDEVEETHSTSHQSQSIDSGVTVGALPLHATSEGYSILQSMMDGIAKDVKRATSLAKVLAQIREAKVCRSIGNRTESDRLLQCTLHSAKSVKNVKLNLYIQQLHSKWNPPYIKLLPQPILEHTFRYMNLGTAFSCLRVCKSWRRLMLKVLQRDVSTPIDHTEALPDELLIGIFGYLNTYDLLACRQTCNRWHQITAAVPGLWKENAILCGNLNQIDAQWKRLCNLSGDGKVKRLTLRCRKQADEVDSDGLELSDDQEEDLECWSDDEIDKKWNMREGGEKDGSKKASGRRRNRKSRRGTWTSDESDDEEERCYSWFDTQLLGEFPCDSLEEVRYRGYSRRLDHRMLRSLTGCTRLKVLKFQSTYQYNNPLDLEVDGTPLINCRLEKFYLTCKDRHERESIADIDGDLYALLSEAKHIRIDFNLSSDEVYQILKSSKDTLETLKLNGNPHLYDREFASDEYDTIVMRKLSRYQGTPFQISFNLQAPQLIDILYTVEKEASFDLLWKCRTQVVNLFYNCDKFDPIRHQETQWRNFQTTFLAQPQLQLESWQAETTRVGQYDSQVPTRIKGLFFPKLECLWLKDRGCHKAGVEMTGEVLVQFLKKRKQIGLPTLQNVVLINCDKFDLDSIAALRKLVVKLELRREKK